MAESSQRDLGNRLPIGEQWASLVAQMIESAWNVGNPGSTPGLERSPGEGNGNPLQYSCLENSMDRGAWLQSMGSQTVGHDGATDPFTLEEQLDKCQLTPHHNWRRLETMIRKKNYQPRILFTVITSFNNKKIKFFI